MSEQRGGDRRKNETLQTCSRSRRKMLKLLGTGGIVGLAGCTGLSGGGDGNSDGGNGGGGDGSGGSDGESQTQMADEMTIFHAGSLSPPFSMAEPKFEERHDVQILQESAGSVESTKKITEQSKKAGVLGVSDFRLLRDTLLPEFGDWYSIFATNAMTVAYTPKSTGATEISPENWWEILSRKDVSVGHSDPALDPNGYRSIMAMQLGKTRLQGNRLYDEKTYQQLRDNAAVTAGAESTLLGQLKTGKLDYAWEYQSAGASHDVKTIDLQPQVDLSKLTEKYAKFYANAKVKTKSGTRTGAPIAYGITVPSVANAPKLGAKWVKFMITKPGEKILKKTGFNPIDPAVVPKSSEDAVPKSVAQIAEAKNSIGPIQLS
jgi:molybdate/tungstate transport system substrate-binding protein